ncbi:NAD(P)H-binding protein [Staphylococcus felis]|uniref:NAD(P)H-binding protein n=1 Tax=Staphylococcus felis TaxID=46127 RepID=UPI000CD322CD|nr:NAD(P)H-binding protein [Staphylococcus felis]AVP36038.1 NmrA family protein [Staphylococcus felis]PNZ36474.1 NmrA family protein [Staphylococcus felis]QQB03993.1 NAD(P)H-binding protein [Staphylococcus felis]
MQKVLLTGASGYIGGHLIEKLKTDYDVIAISRNIENKKNERNVTWKSADLFDLNKITEVMRDIDIAIYLVHPMMSSAKLTQAKFEDMDALLADNFGRAAQKNNVKHIVFLNGLIPESDNVSIHLRNRLECEAILGSYGVPVRTLQAGRIIGGAIDFKESIRSAFKKEKKVSKHTIKDVRAISRVTFPNDMTMSNLVEVYAKFLNNMTLHVINCHLDDNHFTITVPFLNKELLLLQKDHAVSDYDYVLYRIVGGDLARNSSRGNARLEFRRLPDSDECIIALQEYEPTLPWWVYKHTQAKVHETVMNLFACKLQMRYHSQGNYTVKKLIVPAFVVMGVILLKKKWRKKAMSNVE